ncbi:hypothetical protein [Nocardia alni]|uniref:hypothetical protein n=1 Tax=Nocardia alni TaxID=2815723 RepID=UPI001C24C3A7|nr:hypothetical protein [Nocardia alni]
MFSGAPGPVRDAVLLNSAAAVVAYELTPAAPIESIHETLSAALTRVATAVDSGAARDLLDRWATLSNKLGND